MVETTPNLFTSIKFLIGFEFGEIDIQKIVKNKDVNIVITINK